MSGRQRRRLRQRQRQRQRDRDGDGDGDGDRDRDRDTDRDRDREETETETETDGERDRDRDTPTHLGSAEVVFISQQLAMQHIMEPIPPQQPLPLYRRHPLQRLQKRRLRLSLLRPPRRFLRLCHALSVGLFLYSRALSQHSQGSFGRHTCAMARCWRRPAPRLSAWLSPCRRTARHASPSAAAACRMNSLAERSAGTWTCGWASMISSALRQVE